jgi:hypothetical protein
MISFQVMKKLIDSLRAAFGRSAPAETDRKSLLVDPKSILFTIPTISNDIAEVEPVGEEHNDTELFVYEDNWSQVEFLSGSLLFEVQQMLTEFKEFEQANRVGHGWRNLYVRKVPRLPMISGAEAVLELQATLGVSAGPAPLLGPWDRVTGRVKNGFSIPLGGNISLYGYKTPSGIPVLCASVGQNPDNLKLTEAFTKLNLSNGLVLVDWRSLLVLMSSKSATQVEVWRP